MAKKRDQVSQNNEAQNQSANVRQVPKAVEQNSKQGDVITLDLQNFLTPIAIVIAGMMISATLFFSLRGTELDKSDVKGTSNTANSNDDDGGDTGTAAAPSDGGFAAAEIDIDDDAVLGDKGKAKVAIVEFSDYECPFCQRHWEQTHGQIYENYIKTGEAIFVYRDMPLSFHPQAKPAAIAANCARDQGGDEAYYKYHDLLFEKGVSRGESGYDEYAQDIGLDMGEFNDCQDSGKFEDEIQNDVTEGNSQSCTGTPCFIIGELDEDGNVVNGKRIAGAYPYASFQQVIDELLQ